MAFTLFIVAFMAFAASGDVATLDDVGAVAPSPAMESAGVALCAPAIVAAMVSLIACLF